MKIIFKNPDNSIGIITPSQEVLAKYTYKQIAEKDVPAGLPYVIVEESMIPSDRTWRSAWELPEDTKFDGVGAETYTFKE